MIAFVCLFFCLFVYLYLGFYLIGPLAGGVYKLQCPYLSNYVCAIAIAACIMKVGFMAEILPKWANDYDDDGTNKDNSKEDNRDKKEEDRKYNLEDG